MNSACRGCHSFEQIRAKSIHAGIQKRESEGKAAFCSDCHEAHSMTAVRGGKIVFVGTSAAALSPAQAARLAAMVPSPRFYDRNRSTDGEMSSSTAMLLRSWKPSI